VERRISGSQNQGGLDRGDSEVLRKKWDIAASVSVDGSKINSRSSLQDFFRKTRSHDDR